MTSLNISVTVPSILGKRRRKREVATKPAKVASWDREVICLPSCYVELFSSNGVMPIPRKKKDVLGAFGLIGKIHLESTWTESEVQDEIRSVFEDAMDKDDSFPFNFLQVTGTGTKSLILPKVSASYKWTPKEVAGRADRPLYILLRRHMKDEV